MANKSTAIPLIDEKESSEATALVAIIEQGIPPDSPKIKDVLIAAARGFLDSLTKREEKAKELSQAALNSVAMNKLVDPKSRAIIVKDQADAELASRLVNELAETEKTIDGLWSKETDFFNKFHKTLTGRRGQYKEPVSRRISMLKTAASQWLAKERARVEAERQKLQAKVDKQAPMAGIAIIAEQPKIAGLQGRTTYKATCVDPLAFMRAVIAKKAPADSFTVNQVKLNGEATAVAYSMAEEKDGKKYLYPGVVIERDDGLARGR